MGFHVVYRYMGIKMGSLFVNLLLEGCYLGIIRQIDLKILSFFIVKISSDSSKSKDLDVSISHAR